jgi:hypothetical protein
VEGTRNLVFAVPYFEAVWVEVAPGAVKRTVQCACAEESVTRTLAPRSTRFGDADSKGFAPNATAGVAKRIPMLSMNSSPVLALPVNVSVWLPTGNAAAMMEVARKTPDSSTTSLPSSTGFEYKVFVTV